MKMVENKIANQVDAAQLVDGDKRTPAMGVKQGRPLSPLPFSLFVNDVKQHVQKGVLIKPCRVCKCHT